MAFPAWIGIQNDALRTPPMNPPSLPSALRKPRLAFITVLAWFTMLVGLIGLPVSFFFVVIVVGKSYATQNSDPIFCLIMVFGPAILLAAGFGLYKRLWWALGSVVGLLALVILSEAWELTKAPRPTTTFIAESGVMTTVLSSGKNVIALPVIGGCAALMMKLLSRGVRAEFRTRPPSDEPFAAPAPAGTPDTDRRGWRVGHRGRDMMYYEEKIGGAWERINIDGEMLTGRAHHVIYFASTERWQNYPEWARHRRDEIIARIKSEFRPPDYEYQ